MRFIVNSYAKYIRGLSIFVLITFGFVVIVIAIMSIIMLSALRVQSPFRSPNLTQMEEYFQADREQLQIIIDYFISTNFDTISISISSIHGEQEVEMFTGLETGRILVSNENVSRTIYNLFNAGYRGIGKSETGIRFLKWAIRDHGRGIVYSINGNVPDETMLPFLTELQPLSEENWFFYVENFNEWRQGVRPNSVEE